MKPTAPENRSGKSAIQALVPAALLAVVVGGLVLIFWPAKVTQTVTAPGPTPSATPEATAATEALDASKRLLSLSGNWMREDGGYRLAIEGVESDGRLRASYFNPNPIRVSLATATNDAGTVKMRVELNDVGYPGCVYSLIHDRVNDRLVGTYFQAAMGETYEVSFVRTP